MSDDYNPYQAPESDLTKTEATAPTGKKYTAVMVEHLRKSRPWILFMAIMGIIGAAIMALSGLGELFFGTLLGSTREDFGNLADYGGASITITGLLYIIMAGVYIPAIVFLFRYAISIKRLLDTGNTESLENALAHQKSFWKYVGILTIVFLCFIILAIIIVIFISISAMK